MPGNDMLTDEELEFLNDFLLERIDEDSVREDDDEGLISVFELDGFLTAVVCAPIFRPPSVWLERIWGDFPPAWRDEAEAEQVMGLLLRHMNSISTLLRADPPEFAPIFAAGPDADAPPILSDWCDGFMDAVQADEEAWSETGADAEEALGVIALFSAATDYAAAELPEADQIAAAELVPDAAARLFELHSAAPPPPATVRRTAPKVGRNDPCPCGSGLKYKLCCLRK